MTAWLRFATLLAGGKAMSVAGERAAAASYLTAELAGYLASEWEGVWAAKADWPQLQVADDFAPRYNQAVGRAAASVVADAPVEAARLGDWPALASALRQRLATAPTAAAGLARLERLRAWRGYAALLHRCLARDPRATTRPAEHRALAGLLRSQGVTVLRQPMDQTWHLPAHQAVVYVRDCHREGHVCVQRRGAGALVEGRCQPDRRAARHLAAGNRVLAVWACVLRSERPWTRSELRGVVAGWLASGDRWDEVG